ncbi:MULTISPECIES: type II toxin-antitoxin system VapC family toxin [unclassified Microcoleus]|uniref:type II toxin-antitoxin system VapC family toxin n=1 Tax=unclassified Microcoleus TaxID=2642155 RepID=UPI001DD45A71|nr:MULTISPECIES: type II toxin-antitoxin system VapC family toxin [unclassified Microcoleus]TAE12619.1 MAG: PIN domain-containing protein [Oscillatoriales cyanobacterium]MCC3414407.1 type II toxin-antitoxin system VapC family toxin [Microcoleus sp. PH2017_02_FOX_O_A]MCC3454516.1 type II toxin-antitoxin system VapC family toxin [Microcoleus sp. PH2017_08_TRC_O_A]MCC3494527.1 type II toxin-antitoxin system VapC family toxin [Microcoleus sp. PH2017_16_JOR_D_A]MCC3513955.1 type II toxin-antitoxin 
MVIDTMVFAYALLRVENHHEQAIAALETAEQIIVPDSLFAELGNVVWQWIQFRQLPIETGLEVLDDAEALIDKIVPSAQVREIALELAVGANHSFYDALFVAVAIREEVQVITFDRKLAAKFPDRVQLLE